MQGQGSQELSTQAEGAQGRLGRAGTSLSPDRPRRGSQVKNLTGLWLARSFLANPTVKVEWLK